MKIPEQQDVRYRMLAITGPGLLPDLLSFENLVTGRSEIRNRLWPQGHETHREEAGDSFQVQFVKKPKRRAESGQSEGRVTARV